MQNQNEIMDKASLRDEIYAYLKCIRCANDCYIAFRSIVDMIKAKNDEINLSPGFFAITMNSLIERTCLEIAKLYVGSGGERTISKLFNIVDRNYSLFERIDVGVLKEIGISSFDADKVDENIDIRYLIEQYRAELQDKEIQIKNLKGIRDKVLAHNDRDYFLNKREISKDYPFLFGDAEELLNFAEKVCNNLLSLLCHEAYFCRCENAGDLVNLINKVKIPKKQINADIDLTQELVLIVDCCRWWKNVIAQTRRFLENSETYNAHYLPWDDKSETCVNPQAEQLLFVITLFNAIEYAIEVNKIRTESEKGLSDLIVEFESIDAYRYIKDVRNMNVHELDYLLERGHKQEAYRRKVPVDDIEIVINMGRILKYNDKLFIGDYELDPLLDIFVKNESVVKERLRTMFESRREKLGMMKTSTD